MKKMLSINYIIIKYQLYKLLKKSMHSETKWEILLSHYYKERLTYTTYSINKTKDRIFFKHTDIPNLGVKVRNMKMDFNIYGTWRLVMFEKLMMKV